jgi:hypothetical protein
LGRERGDIGASTEELEAGRHRVTLVEMTNTRDQEAGDIDTSTDEKN